MFWVPRLRDTYEKWSSMVNFVIYVNNWSSWWFNSLDTWASPNIWTYIIYKEKESFGETNYTNRHEMIWVIVTKTWLSATKSNYGGGCLPNGVAFPSWKGQPCRGSHSWGERDSSAWRSLWTIITWDPNWLDSFMYVGAIIAYTIGYAIHNTDNTY